MYSRGAEDSDNQGSMILEDSRFEFCQKIEIFGNSIFFSFFDSCELLVYDQTTGDNDKIMKTIELDHTKGDIITDFGIKNSNIFVIFNGIKISFFSLENSQIKKVKLLKSLILPMGMYYSVSMSSYLAIA